MNYEKLMSKKNGEGKDAVDLLNEASEFMDKDKFQNAIDLLTEAIGLCGHPRFYFNRGYCYHQLKDKKNAIKDFTKCLANDRGNDLQEHEKQRLYLYHGIIYEEMGEDEKAADNFKKAADRGYAGAITRLEKMGIEYTPNSNDEDSKSSEKLEDSSRQKQREHDTKQGTQQNKNVSVSNSSKKEIPLNKKSRFSGLLLPTIVGFIIGVILIMIVSNLPRNETAKSAAKKPPKVTAIVTSDATQLRSEPYNNSYILKILHNGNIVEVKGETSGEWTNVEYEGTEGWVSSELIELKK